MTAIVDITHDPQAQRFFLDVGGQQARLDYRLSDSPTAGEKSTINFTHTFVPPEFRGRGYAERLVRHGLKWAKDQGYAIQASCWYVGKFLRQENISSQENINR